MKFFLLAGLMLTGCESSRQFGSMLWAQPACVLICVTTQTIVADNTALTGAERDAASLQNVTMPAVSEPLEEMVVGK